MLATYLKSTPRPKFIVIEDTLQDRGNSLMAHLINTHLQLNSTSINYCEFEFNRHLNKLPILEKVQKHNFIEAKEDIHKLTNCVLIIDSLAHMVFQNGAQLTYRILQKIKQDPGVHQIITILHRDLFDDGDDIFRYVEHLSTLNIAMEPNERVRYTFHKNAGKIIKEIEKYSFENGVLLSEKIEKLDPKSLIEEVIVAPETLSTFKIGLGDKDIESRQQLVLPYLPKEETGGSIIYEFDEADDWDEEDPDDDLDI